jgi:glycerol-3-phosphate dehydrogenase (NAD(P)+)
MKKIVILGSGAMGSAFAVPCIENKNDVTISGTHLEDDLIKDIISNDHFHPGLKTKLPKEIKFIQFNELQSILEKDVDLIVAGISSIGIEWFVKQISKNYKKKLPIVLLTKGLSIVDNELTTLSDKIKNLLEKDGHSEINISAIKGPCLAAGLANKMRTGTVIANQDIKECQLLKNIISTNYYSAEISEDITGSRIIGSN